MPGHTYDEDEYRFGFNGMLSDEEVNNGWGLSYNTEFRQYDPRLGKWLSVDPLAADFTAWSPYNYVLGQPTMFIDPDGRAPRGYCGGQVGGGVPSNPFIRAASSNEVTRVSQSFERNVDNSFSVSFGTQMAGAGIGFRSGDLELSSGISVGATDFSLNPSTGQQETTITALSVSGSATFMEAGFGLGVNIGQITASNNGVNGQLSNFQTGVGTGPLSVDADSDDFITGLSIKFGEVSATVVANITSIGDSIEDFIEVFTTFIKEASDEATQHTFDHQKREQDDH